MRIRQESAPWVDRASGVEGGDHDRIVGGLLHAFCLDRLNLLITIIITNFNCISICIIVFNINHSIQLIQFIKYCNFIINSGIGNNESIYD